MRRIVTIEQRLAKGGSGASLNTRGKLSAAIASALGLIGATASTIRR
ncbi:MAG: hypothetical protein ABR501_13885 [Pyrinomonadaceae bacterium]